MNGISLCVCILCVCKHAQPLALRIKGRNILQVIALSNFFVWLCSSFFIIIFLCIQKAFQINAGTVFLKIQERCFFCKVLLLVWMGVSNLLDYIFDIQ